jgi:hypothetical protein
VVGKKGGFFAKTELKIYSCDLTISIINVFRGFFFFFVILGVFFFICFVY